MGQAVSQEHRLRLKVLQPIVRAAGFKLTEKQLEQLLLSVKEHCNWFPRNGTFDTALWERVGEHVQTRKELGLALPDSAITTWKSLFAASHPLQASEADAERKPEADGDDNCDSDDVIPSAPAAPPTRTRLLSPTTANTSTA